MHIVSRVAEPTPQSSPERDQPSHNAIWVNCRGMIADPINCKHTTRNVSSALEHSFLPTLLLFLCMGVEVGFVRVGISNGPSFGRIFVGLLWDQDCGWTGIVEIWIEFEVRFSNLWLFQSKISRMLISNLNYSRIFLTINVELVEKLCPFVFRLRMSMLKDSRIPKIVSVNYNYVWSSWLNLHKKTLIIEQHENR